LTRMQRSMNHFINRVEYQEVGAGHDLVDPGAALRIGLEILPTVAIDSTVNHGFNDAGARPPSMGLIGSVE
jgi:hypothetical protein